MYRLSWTTLSAYCPDAGCHRSFSNTKGPGSANKAIRERQVCLLQLVFTQLMNLERTWTPMHIDIDNSLGRHFPSFQ